MRNLAKYVRLVTFTLAVYSCTGDDHDERSKTVPIPAQGADQEQITPKPTQTPDANKSVQQNLALFDLLSQLQLANTAEGRQKIIELITKLDLSALRVDQLPPSLRGLLGKVDANQIANGVKIGTILQESMKKDPAKFDEIIKNIVSDFSGSMKNIAGILAGIPIQNAVNLGQCGVEIAESYSNKCEDIEALKTKMIEWCKADGGTATVSNCGTAPLPAFCPPAPRVDTVCLRNNLPAL